MLFYKLMICLQLNLPVVWISILIGYCIPLWDKVYWSHGEEYIPIVSAIFHPLCRMIWSLCVSSMILLCVTGNGGVINRILSLKLFVPLARLTYSVYLVHAWVLWHYIGSRRHLIDTSIYDIFVIFLHHLVMSYVMGLAFYVLFESPILEFQRYLLEILRRKCEKTIPSTVELQNLK